MPEQKHRAEPFKQALHTARYLALNEGDVGQLRLLLWRPALCHGGNDQRGKYCSREAWTSGAHCCVEFGASHRDKGGQTEKNWARSRQLAVILATIL